MAYELELLGSAGVHAIGRVSYEGMGPSWMKSTSPMAPIMNDIPKAVFSTTLEAGSWPETTVHHDIEAGIAERLRAAPEQMQIPLAHVVLMKRPNT